MLPKLSVLGFLVMAQVIPTSLISNGLPAIYRSQGLELEHFWMFALPEIPIWFKWLLGPVVDRYGNRRIGRRKSWIIPFTLLGAASFLAISFLPPARDSLITLVGLLFLMRLFMSIQDVAVDAYTVEALDGRDRVYGGTAIQLGQMLGYLAATSGLMVLYGTMGWEVAIRVGAVALILFTLPALFRREQPATISAARGFSETLLSLVRRADARAILGIVLLTGVYLGFGHSLTNVVLVDRGLSVAEIGIAMGTSVTLGGFLGAALATYLMAKLGENRAPRVAIILVAAAHLVYIVFAFLPAVAPWQAWLGFLISETLVTPFFMSISVARLRWTAKSQAATDYTAQSSLRIVGASLGTAAAATLASWTGWLAFFVIVALFAVAVATIFALAFGPIDRLVALRDAAEREAGRIEPSALGTSVPRVDQSQPSPASGEKF